MSTLPAQESVSSVSPWGNQEMKEIVNIRELMQEAIQDGLSQQGDECVLDLPSGIWDVDSSQGTFAKAISGLLHSAAQCMPEGGKVFVKVENIRLQGQEGRLAALEPGAYVRVTLNNGGPDMAADSRTREEAVALPGLTRSSSSDGSLAFFLRAAKDCQLPPLEDHAAKQRILVMDDDEAVCEIATQMLDFLGYEVSVSMDGDEAVTRYQEAQDLGKPFDAVILDLTIPDGPGAEETVRRLEAIDPNVVALISSGYFDDPAMCQFQEHGFCGAITKPFRIKALSSVLKAAMALGKEGAKC